MTTDNTYNNVIKDDLWKTMKNALLEGHDLSSNLDGTKSENDNKRKVMDYIFEKYRLLIQKMNDRSGNQACNIASMTKIILPVIRRVVAAMFVHDVINVDTVLPEGVDYKREKLAARWTFETAQEVKNSHGLDIEAEIMAAMAQEITAEIDYVFINDLKKMIDGKKYPKFDQLEIAGTDFPDMANTFASLIFSEMKRIRDNFKKEDNKNLWCIVSPTSLTLIQSYMPDVFKRVGVDEINMTNNTKFFGHLDGMRLYVNQYAADDEPIIIGYKDKDNSLGTFYPGCLMSSSGVTIDPTTFEPIVSFMTEYARTYVDDVDRFLGAVEIEIASFKTFL